MNAVCLQCHKIFTVPDGYSGTELPCPECQKAIHFRQTKPIYKFILVGLVCATFVGVIGFGFVAIKEAREEVKTAKDEIERLTSELKRSKDTISRLRIAKQGTLDEKQGTTPSRRPYEERRPYVDNQKWEVIDIKTKITEKNNVFWQFSWRLTVKNNFARPISLSGEIEFQDKEGFIVDKERLHAIDVPANSSETFTGSAAVTTKTAPTIANTVVKLKGMGESKRRISDEIFSDFP